jgi:hypothetical protein
MKPVLVTIPVSHYCEKARWALSWANIDFEERPNAPVFHLLANRKIGAGRTVPALATMDGALADSTDILQWIDARMPDDTRLFGDDPTGREAARLEEIFDEKTTLVLISLLLISCGQKEEKNSIVGSYDLSSPKRGSKLDIKILSNNQYSGYINAFYEYRKSGDGMVNICDIEGVLKPVSENKFLLGDDNSEVTLTVTKIGINVIGTKLDGCGLGVSKSVIGNYKKIVDKK